MQGKPCFLKTKEESVINTLIKCVTKKLALALERPKRLFKKTPTAHYGKNETNSKIDGYKDNYSKNEKEASIPEPKTLKDLASTGKTYWKFSQSCEKIKSSAESQFLDYPEHSIIIAKDPEHEFLSFTSEENIGKCYMYGDQITQINIDLNDPEFQKIADTKLTYTGNGFGEFYAQKIYTGKNYSMRDPSNVAMVLRMSNTGAMMCFINGIFGEQEQRFRKMGFKQSADMLAYIKNNYMYRSDDMLRLKEDLDTITMKFVDKKESD